MLVPSESFKLNIYVDAVLTEDLSQKNTSEFGSQGAGVRVKLNESGGIGRYIVVVIWIVVSIIFYVQPEWEKSIYQID